ncbi:MAG: type II toxin-antitoxin system VapB family antitoxin [Planctomycetes bacterium]|nr:type II toxin-antitoxin system VapB family antitoxin [Planctomycetota bacterium]
MPKRTTVELDEQLLARAKRALGGRTTRATIEEALRRASEQAEDAQQRRAEDQRRYLNELPGRADLEVLASEEMWR